MDLRQLRYFVAIAEAGSFHRAGERLHVAQPALSRQIRQLEDETGLLLLERLPTGVAPTAAGRSLLEDARRILAEVEGSIERARQASRGMAGSIGVSFTPVSMRHHRMGEFLRRFREACGDIEIKLVTQGSEEQLDALWAGKIDAAFISNGLDPQAHGFSSLRVDTTVLELIAASFHRFAAQKLVTMEDLRAEPLVLPPASVYRHMRARLMRAFLRAGYSPNVAQEVENDSAIGHLVAAGLGVSFVRTLVQPALPPGLVMRPVDGLNISVPIDLIWRPDNRLPALRRFLDVMRTTLAPPEH